MSKPLVRWTISGVCSRQGFICLKCSVRFFRNIYKELDYVVCHNNLDAEQLKFVQSLGVPLVDQSLYVHSLPIPPDYCAWKFYPPRLKPGSHEIYMDNDILWHKKSPSVDVFLQSNKLLCSEAATPISLYGQYPNMLGRSINAGMIGVPPNFDLASAISNKIQGPWSTHFDDQGMFAWIVSENAHIYIPLLELWICGWQTDDDFTDKHCGWHFVALNKGYVVKWNAYINKLFLGIS